MKNLYCALALIFLMSTAAMANAEPRVYFSPKGGCQEAVITEINKARETIDIAMYSFTSREIAQALIKAKKRDVKVRIAMDNDQIKDHTSKSRYLISKGITVKFHMGPGLLHDKFAVIDDKTVITGSFNWTNAADKKNAENLLILNDKSLAQKYKNQFKIIWSQSGESQLKELLPVAGK